MARKPVAKDPVVKSEVTPQAPVATPEPSPQSPAERGKVERMGSLTRITY